MWNIEDNKCLFTLSSIEIKYKTKHCQGEKTSILIHKMFKEEVIKRKMVNLQMRKISKAVEEKKLSIMTTRFEWEFNL